jgi:hypothetical protein
MNNIINLESTIFQKIFISLVVLFSAQTLWSDDYKSAQKFNDGDVVSAQVLNDIIDRMELALKTTVSSDLVGTWDLVQTTCAGDGGLGNCTSISGTTGFGSNQDSLFKQRSDTVTFSDDGDGTFSLSQTNYCAFVRSGTGNSPCDIKYAVVDNRFIFNSFGFTAYNLQKISASRYTLTINASGSASFNIIRLDKKNLIPEAPTNLTLSIASDAITQSWTAVSGATSYEIYRKTSDTGTFSSVGTSTNTSFTDTNVSSGSNYWYRIFAINSNGTSTGSNVVKVTFNPAANLSTSNIEIIDFYNGEDSKKAKHKIYYTTTNNVMNANLSVGKLDKENLNGLLAGSNGKSPIIKFGLSSFPSAGMSGTATLSTKLIDGNDSSVDAGERVIAANADISWLSDGEKLVLTVPNQSSNVSLNDGDGTTLSGNWAIGGSSDLMTVSSTGLNKPVTLDIKLLEFLSANIAANGPSIGNFFSEGAYFFEMGISGIDLIDSSGNSFSKVQGTFGVDSNPLSIAYIDDVKVQENTGTATVIVSLSSPSINEVKLDYSTSESSATNGQDFTPTSGSLRIAAGDVKGAFTIPLINDAISENNEIFNISFSNILNAELGRNTSSITIIDNDTST